METEVDYAELVRQAQRGDKESLSRLAEAAVERLRTDVYRLTMRREITEDIAQESILEMFKKLNNLREPERFWPWLYKIALNKIRSHYRSQRRGTTGSLSAGQEGALHDGGQKAVSDMVSEELKEIVLSAMRALKPRQRTVLTMRCYREMKYSLIAESMGCSEFAARVLFYRAKKALRRQLARQGFGRGTLLTALILFGKLTAPTEAAAANVSVTAATVKVGVAAGLAGVMTGKAAVVSVATAGALGVGTMMVTSGSGNDAMMPAVKKPSESAEVIAQAVPAGRAMGECWYYYPSNSKEAVMIRLVKGGSRGRDVEGLWHQNEYANYYFDSRSNTTYINNYRMWAGDLKVQRLPADSPELSGFISAVEGRQSKLEYVRRDADGLLVIVKKNRKNELSQITHRYDVLDEEYFRYNWPTRADVVDNRDAMHKRGWTYFRIAGEVNGEKVCGAGRIPFVYATSETQSAWLKMKVGQALEIVDDGVKACVFGTGRAMPAGYEGGSFFKGLGRPWTGLHTIDIVRRDAAERRVWFEARYAEGGGKVLIVLRAEQGEIHYVVDMKTDIIEKIILSTSEGKGGELRFSYLQAIGSVGDEFAEPRLSRYGAQREHPGVLWLLDLAKGEIKN